MISCKASLAAGLWHTAFQHASSVNVGYAALRQEEKQHCEQQFDFNGLLPDPTAINPKAETAGACLM